MPPHLTTETETVLLQAEERRIRDDAVRVLDAALGDGGGGDDDRRWRFRRARVRRHEHPVGGGGMPRAPGVSMVAASASPARGGRCPHSSGALGLKAPLQWPNAVSRSPARVGCIPHSIGPLQMRPTLQWHSA